MLIIPKITPIDWTITGNIFLDDVRDPYSDMNYMDTNIYINNKWDIVRDTIKFRELLHKTSPSELKIISFDHDLDNDHYGDLTSHLGEPNTGGEAVSMFLDWIIANRDPLKVRKQPMQIILHSKNGHGIRYMNNKLHKFLKTKAYTYFTIIYKTPAKEVLF